MLVCFDVSYCVFLKWLCFVCCCLLVVCLLCCDVRVVVAALFVLCVAVCVFDCVLDCGFVNVLFVVLFAFV